MARDDSSEDECSSSRDRTRTFSSCSMASSDDQQELGGQRSAAALDYDNQTVADVSLTFLYQPHTLTMLCTLMFLLVYVAFKRDPDISTHANYWSGVIGILVVFSSLSVLICPNGPFTRPHPAIWRIVLGVSILYLLMLVFVLFQSYEDCREMLGFLDPALRHSGPDNELYAEDCEFSFEKIMTRVDVFVTAHFLGWVMKAMLLRHAGLSWLISVLWEVTEIAFAHLLENFKECWWDSLLLDVIICNGLGIHCGLFLCRKLEMRKFYWESIKDIRGAGKKFRRAVLQFTPVSWMEVRWFDRKCSFTRYVAVCLLIIFWQISELNTFFLKHIFMIPTKHPINLYRLIFICLIVAPTLRQYYVYVTDTRCKKFGTQCWVFVCITLLEMLICIIHGRELFSRTDAFAIITWVLFQLVVCFIAIYLIVMMRNWRQKNDDQEAPPPTANLLSARSIQRPQAGDDRPNGLRFSERNIAGDAASSDEDHGIRTLRRRTLRDRRIQDNSRRQRTTTR